LRGNARLHFYQHWYKINEVGFSRTLMNKTDMKKFSDELAGLRQKVVEMGNLAEQMVDNAINAISAPGRDELIHKVVQDEDLLDHMQIKLDKESIRLLTIYSPVAGDLRFVMSVSRITSELERMGDHACNMCQAIQLMASKTGAPPLPMLLRMSGVVRTMVRDALDAFLHDDVQKAKATIASDDMADALNDQLIEELLSDEVVRTVVNQDKDIAGALAQLLIGRSLERIADQSTNVSEEIIYMVRGDDVRHIKRIEEI
jgi:phosphate transport system protein